MKTIPKKIPLPLWEIRVSLVSPEELARVAEDADSVFHYVNDYGEILINKKLPKEQQIYQFAHEMQHAMIDYMHKVHTGELV